MKLKLSLNFKITMLVIIILNVILILIGTVIVKYIYLQQINQLEQTALDLAQTIARIPIVINNLNKENGEKIIQSLVEGVRQNTRADFIVVMDMKGIRYSHPIEERVGKHFVGGDEKSVLEKGKSYVSSSIGTLGKSRRAFVPIYRDQKQVGAVAVGILEKGFQKRLNSILYSIYFVLILGEILGIVGSILLGNNIKKDIFGLEPIEIAKLLKERIAIIDLLKEGIIVIDKNERITLVNKAAKKILGYEEEIKGKKIGKIISTTRLPNLLKTGKSEYNEEQIINNTIILTNRIPIKVKDEVVGAIASFNKRTAVQKLAEELTGIQKFVEALRSQNHEFINKLHTISGLIQLGDYDKAVSLIFEVSSKKQKLTSFILERFTVNEIAGLLIGKYDRASELRIDFLIDYNSSLQKNYSEEFKSSLITIIGNLLENAIESLDKPRIKRKEIYFAIFEKNDGLEIIVRDTGIGISKEIQTKIFERDFSTKSSKGRGIGLDLVKRNVELFNGNLELSSRLNQGTEIIITIPH